MLELSSSALHGCAVAALVPGCAKSRPALLHASAVAVGKFKVVGFARLLELHTALRRRLRAVRTAAQPAEAVAAQLATEPTVEAAPAVEQTVARVAGRLLAEKTTCSQSRRRSRRRWKWSLLPTMLQP